jgi:hypothetical protein
MPDTADNSANVTIVERINGWWVDEVRADGQHQLHGPYPDEAAAQSEAALMGGADSETAIELPSGHAVEAEAEARADQARELPGG